MFIVDEETGDITLRQGDSGEYVLSNIETDYDFVPYFAVIDDKGNPVGEELVGQSVHMEDGTICVGFTLQPSFTDLLTVKKGEEEAIYTFAVKLSNNTIKIEDTLTIGNKDIYEPNIITVLPKISEGGK